MRARRLTALVLGCFSASCSQAKNPVPNGASDSSFGGAPSAGSTNSAGSGGTLGSGAALTPGGAAAAGNGGGLVASGGTPSQQHASNTFDASTKDAANGAPDASYRSDASFPATSDAAPFDASGPPMQLKACGSFGLAEANPLSSKCGEVRQLNLVGFDTNASSGPTYVDYGRAVRNGSGFLATRIVNVSDDVNYVVLYQFDSVGNCVESLWTSDAGVGMPFQPVSAETRGGTTATLLVCNSTGPLFPGYCGTRVLIVGSPAFDPTLGALTQSEVDELSVGVDGNVLLASALESGTLRFRLYSPNGSVVKDVTTTGDGYVPVDVLSTDAGQFVVALTIPATLAGAPSMGRVVLLDSNLGIAKTWQAPNGIALTGLATRGSDVFVVGNLDSSYAETGWLEVLSADGLVAKLATPATFSSGGASAVGVASNGDPWIFGWASRSNPSPSEAWLATYDVASGRTGIPTGGNDSSETFYGFPQLSVVQQGDGRFLATGPGFFSYCPG
jgi:hypothetical protein